jgi:hypothetical protein
VFQIVVGPWEIGQVVAREQPWPVAISHFEKCRDHLAKQLRGASFFSHLIEQGLIVLPYFLSGLLVRIGEKVRSPIHPGIPGLHIGPEISGCS